MEDLPASMIASVDPPTHKHPKKANITWKNSVKRFNQLFWLGLKDALQWETAVKLIKSSPEIKDLLWKSFMLNFCLFIVSLVLRHYYYELLLSLLSQSQSILVSNVGYYFSHFLLLLYDILWIFPMYLISFWLNGLWYSEVSRLSYQWAVAQHLRPSVRAPGLSPWKLIAELLYSSLVLACYVLQAALFALIPHLGKAVQFVLFAWLYSYYCFEYVWVLRGDPLTRRFAYFHQHWVYLLAFGTPFALGTFFFPYLLSTGVIGLLFPLFIIQAAFSLPKRQAPGTCHFPDQIPVFLPASAFTSIFIRSLVSPLYSLVTRFCRKAKAKPS